MRATQFRQWATQVLREFAIKGYVLDKKRMENGTFLGEDYFEPLLEEIREIRLSERRFYQKITDIYAAIVDYNKDAPTTKVFFAKVQKKLHFTIHGNTAAELIMTRIEDIDLNEKDVFHYLFDFGDDWWHRIRVQSIRTGGFTKKLIKVIKSVGRSPGQYPDYDDYEDQDYD